MITNEKDGSELILIPAGEFTMGSQQGEGSNCEHPRHKVCLEACYVGKHEVTNGQFARFVDETGYRAQGDWKEHHVAGRENHPVVRVSWNDAKAYCDWANLRLPTEAEWEKAARGPDEGTYPWGNEWDASRCNWWHGPESPEMANISFGRGTLPVGSFPGGASPYGCLDMAGNVWEWCADWFEESYYRHSPPSNPVGPERGGARVLRGGSWLNEYPDNLRCANRRGGDPINWYNYLSVHDLGFRICRSADR
ncbi:MAG: formylglycine-generating enzyme family protein [bacterium]